MTEYSPLLLVAAVDVAFRTAHGQPPSSILFSEANPHGFMQPVIGLVRDGQFIVAEARYVSDDA